MLIRHKLLKREAKFMNVYLQITALCVIPMTWQYWVIVVGLIIGGGILFFIMAKIGEKLLVNNHLKDMQMTDQRQLHCYDNKVAISMAD